MRTTILFFVLVCVCGSALRAQGSLDISNAKIKWISKEFLNPASNSYDPLECSFTTEVGEKKIFWNQHEKVTYELVITKVTGSWKNVEESGSIKFEVEMGKEKDKGELIIKRDGDWMTLLLDFKRARGDIKYEFVISKIEVL